MNLLDYFSHYYATETKQEPMRFTDQALDRLGNYQWPGNVRELRNVVHRFYLTKSDDLITEQDLPPEVQDNLESDGEDALMHITGGAFRRPGKH